MKRIAPFLITALLAGLILSACSTQPSAGQLLMDVTGETVPIEKRGLFGRNYDFWTFRLRDVSRSARQTTVIGVMGAEKRTYSRGIGFTLQDDAGYSWEMIGVAEMTSAKLPENRGYGQTGTYTFRARIKESVTGVQRVIDAVYDTNAEDFDGSFRGRVSSETGETLFTFESNARLDTYDQPDEGLAVFSIFKNEEVVAVLDSRNGYEVTFYQGLQPTERTQLAVTIGSLFTLMRYGSL